jgi:hypothetical protein
MTMPAELDFHECAGCASHPSRIPVLVEVPPLEKIQRPRWRRRLKKVAIIGGATAFTLAGAVAGYVGISIYKIDHAVHHIALPSSLLAKGDNDLLAVVLGPNHFEQIFVFHTTDGHTNVLKVPSDLGVAGGSGSGGASSASVPLSHLNIRQPDAILSGLRELGIPVGRYVGVDLHAANPSSALGRLALGKTDMTELISHPAGTASLMEAVASHVYLGPHTSVSSLLTLMHVPTGNPVSVPTSTTASGQVVLAGPATDVLRHFL